MALSFGCQTYTWQMSYQTYKDQLSHILGVIHQAGFDGVEAEVCMMGDFYENPARFADELAKREIKLAALTLALPWLAAKESEEEKQEAERLFSYLKYFPEAKLVLVQLPGRDRATLAERQKNCLSCVNAVAQRAHEQGVISAFHPNSPEGSVFRTAEDYKVMFELLDERYVGYCPDSGHIANGDMNVLEIFKSSRQLIRHVHFKDISVEKEWKAMGQGVIDHPSLIKYLKDTGYNGWIMVEEESHQAELKPDEVTLENGSYTKNILQRI